jgi:hypothetical protein
LTVLVRPTASELFPDANSYPWTEVNADRFFGLGFENYVTSRCRFLGGAIEVTDTTPELYKGGSISVADVSSSFERICGLIRTENQSGTNPNYRTYVTQDYHNAPPGTLAEITLLPGCQTWEMSKGCYAVMRQSKVENPYRPTVWTCPVWGTSYPSYAAETTYGVGNEPTIIGQYAEFGSVTTATTYPQLAASQPIPFDVKAILCSNLNPNFSLRINFNAIIEAIPDLDDQTLLVLAKPSPSLDMRALEAYSDIIRGLPSAVVVADNASGKWWDKVLGAIEEYAGPIGKTLGDLGVPMASVIGKGVSTAAGMGKKALEKKQSNTNQASNAKNGAKKK